MTDSKNILEVNLNLYNPEGRCGLPRRPFTDYERGVMVAWLIRTKNILKGKSENTWEEMIKADLLVHRTKKSLREHFVKVVLQLIPSATFLSDEQKELFSLMEYVKTPEPSPRCQAAEDAEAAAKHPANRHECDAFEDRDILEQTRKSAMESRLLKPKALFHLEKTIEPGETRSETIEMSNSSSALLKPTTKTATTVSDLKTIGKSKSTPNVNANLSNEKYEKSAQLETIVNELRAKETEMSLKIEKLEDTNAALSEELATTKQSYADLLQSHDALSEKLRDLQSLVHRMDRDRRYMHNAIQELKGNIRVFCRVRPRIDRETSKIACSINFIDESTMEISRAELNENASNCGGQTRCASQKFTFDKIFPPSATQAHVFEELSMLVQSALEGYNVCVFAYGQTGSGKTYTMEGGKTENNEGMIPRTVRHIFEEMKQFELLGWEYRIEASCLEIYNEHIVDLLDFKQKDHKILMADSKGNDLVVTNLKIAEINSPEELHVCLRTAQKNRAVAATKSNERSSRSHSVTRIRLIGTHAGKNEQSIGNLNLVDLAGSERFKGEEEERTLEMKNINTSLANLVNVILALSKKQDHVPYRNSKLTHLLMPSLGGNSKTLMLLNVSPLDECFNETLNSLRFAINVNSCKTGNVKRARTIINNPL